MRLVYSILIELISLTARTWLIYKYVSTSTRTVSLIAIMQDFQTSNEEFFKISIYLLQM